MDNQPQQENHPSEKQRKVFPWIRIFFSSKWLFSILVGLMVAELVCTGIYVFAAPPASPYNPGEILDPTCAPLDLNCTTVPPAVYDFGANNFNGTGTFTGGYESSFGISTPANNKVIFSQYDFGGGLGSYPMIKFDSTGQPIGDSVGTMQDYLAVVGVNINPTLAFTDSDLSDYTTITYTRNTGVVNVQNVSGTAPIFNFIMPGYFDGLGTAATTKDVLTLAHHVLGLGSDNDGVKQIFRNRNDFPGGFGWAQPIDSYITSIIDDVSDGTEDTSFHFGGYTSGASADWLTMTGTSANFQGLNISTTGTINSGTVDFAGTNTKLGYQALANNTGTNNTAVGREALGLNTTGYNNTATGFRALYSNTTTGANNAAFGYQALYANTTGIYNAAFGRTALQDNTTGSYNTASGGQALQSNTDGTENSAFGSSALLSNTTGDENIAIGRTALFSNQTGSYNTAVGTGALRSNTTNSLTAVGYNALYSNTNGSNNTAVGYGALSDNQTGGHNSAFGSTALNNNTGGGNTAVGSNALFTNIGGGNNVAVGLYSLYNNTTANYNTAVGNSALRINLTGGSNTALGYNALYYSTGSSNTAVGYAALEDNTANNMTAVGYNALANNTSGSSNVAVGNNALYTNITGVQNTAVGYNALYANTGSNNTAIGMAVLTANTSGYSNTAVGSGALSVNTSGRTNTAIGQGTLNYNTTGTDNTAIGAYSLNSNTGGYQNAAIGESALSANTTGSWNIAFGTQSLGSNDSGNYNTAIGDYSLSSTTTGTNNVAIGYYAGAYETGSDTFYVNNHNTSDNDTTDSLLYGVFNSSPGSQALSINAGSIYMSYLPIGTGSAGAISADTTTGKLYVASSSLRYKHNVQPLIENWTAILQTQPKSFKYNGSNQPDIGYIAEDLDVLGLKDLVLYDTEGRPNAIKYDRVSLYSIEILKQQQIAINELKQRLGLPTDNTTINPAGTLGSGEVSGVTLSSFDQSVQSSLANLGATLSGGIISLKQVITENLTAKTARVEKMEIVASNGDIYCTWIDNDGNWQKAKGDCASISVASATETVVTSATTAQVFQQVTEQQQAAQEVQQATQAAQQATQQAQQAAQEAQQAAQEVQQAQEQAQPQVLNIASVNVIPDINVEYGTALASANLPTTVSATLSDNTTQTLTIIWDNGMPSYDPNTAGTYVFFGTLTLPENVTNTDNINATVNVVVASQPQEEPTVLESVSGLIQSAVASLLNGVWNLITGMINSVAKAVLSISVIQKATATLIMQTPEALQSWTLEIKSLTTGFFDPITELLR